MYLILLTLFFFLFLVSQATTRKSLKKLPPGPMGIPIFGYLPFMGKIPSLTVTQLAKKYGNIFSMYLGKQLVVFVNDFDSMKEMGKMDVFQGRNQIELIVKERGSTGLGLLEGKDWQEWRRFTLKSLRDMGFGKVSMEGIIQEQVQEARALLKRNVNKAMYLKPALEIAAVNCVWQILTSQKYDLEDARMREGFHILSEGFSDQNIVGTVIFLPWLAKLAPEYTGYTKGLRYLEAPDALLQDILKDHIETYEAGRERDFIDVALTRIYNESNPNSSFYKQVGLTNLRFTMADLFFGGSDTLGTTLGWAFVYLASFPYVQERVHEEIDTVLGRSTVPTIEDRKRMPYVEATMMEVFRKSSIGPLGLMHSAVEDNEYQGYFIPSRTVVMFNLYHIHHDPTHWGDPDNFRPDRFINSDGTVRKDERVIPFSTGKRSCPAESLATNEFFLFFAGILQQFSFELEPGKEAPYLGQRQGMVQKPPEHKLIVLERA